VPAQLSGVPDTASGPELQCTTPTISLGTLRTSAHQVTGEVTLLSESVFLVTGFVYDGQGPAAYFWADSSPNPSVNGIRLYDSAPVGACGMTPLVAADGSVQYRVEFPKGTTVNDFLGGCKFR